MKIQLKDFRYNNMNYFLLGAEKAAEKFIEWSKRQKIGESFTKKLSQGLDLICIANKETPFIEILFNAEQFSEFWSSLGPINRTLIEASGFGFAAPYNFEEGEPKEGENLQVAIYLSQLNIETDEATKNELKLGCFTPHETGTCVLGKMRFQEDGIWFAKGANAFEESDIAEAQQPQEEQQPSDDSMNFSEEELRSLLAISAEDGPPETPSDD